MTPHEIIIRLRDYAARAERRAAENRWEHRRHEAKGEAKAYRNAAEWVQLMEVKK